MLRSDDDSSEFGEIVGDDDAQTPFELFRDKNMRDELSELLEVLNHRERKIIFERFGLDGGKPETLEELGKQFGVTRERIRQLQNIALAKLRRALAKREKPIVGRDPIQFLKPVSPGFHHDKIRRQETPAYSCMRGRKSARATSMNQKFPYILRTGEKAKRDGFWSARKRA